MRQTMLPLRQTTSASASSRIHPCIFVYADHEILAGDEVPSRRSLYYGLPLYRASRFQSPISLGEPRSQVRTWVGPWNGALVTSCNSVGLMSWTAVLDAADDHAVVDAVGNVDAVPAGGALQRHRLHVRRRQTLQPATQAL